MRRPSGRRRHVVAALVVITSAAAAFPASGARSGLWHDCVRPGERHGFIRASDGVRIAYAEAGQGRRGIVFAHGARGDLCNWMWALRDTRLQRYRMIAFDFRGSGLSDYPNYPRSIGFRKDVIAAVARLRREGSRKVATLGISRGGPAALAAAAQLYPRQVQAAIGVAPIDELVGDSSIAAVRGSRVPLLVMVNAHDGLGLTPTARAIYRASASPRKQLVIAPGQGHGDVFGFPRAWHAFVTFLRRELG